MCRMYFSHKGAPQPASPPASMAMSALGGDSDEEVLTACQALEQKGILGVKSLSCQPAQTVNLTAQTGEAGDDTSKRQELPASPQEASALHTISCTDSIDIFARQLSHPHLGAHSPQACCPANHLLTRPDTHLSPC